MGNEIKIIIGGDASQLTTAVKESNEALGTFTGLTNQTAGSLRKVATESANTATELKKVSKAAENLIPEGSILEAEESVKRLKGEVKSLTDTQLKSDSGKFLISELKAAEVELQKLKTEAGLAKEKVEKIIPPKLPLGAIEEARAKIKALQSQILSLNTTQIKSGVGKAISADLKIAQKELVALEAQAGLTSANTGNLFKQAFGGLRTLANILPGVGIAGIIAFATEPLIDYVSALFDAGKESKATKEAVEKLKGATDNAFSSVAQEATNVGTLVSALKSETETRQQKLAAIKELQNIAPENFKNLKLEGDAVVGLDAAYQSYKDNLRTVIAVKIQQAQVEQLIEKLLKKQGANLLGAQSLGTIESAKRELKSLQDLQKQGQIVNPAQLKLLEGFIKKQSGDIDDLNKQIDQLFDNIQILSKGIKINTNDGDKKKEEDFLKKRLEALEKIKAVTKDSTQLVSIQESIFEVQTKIAIRDQGKNQLSNAEVDQQIQGFKEQLNTAFKNQAIELEAIPKIKFSPTTKLDFQEIANKAFTSKEKIVLSLGEKGIDVRLRKESVDVSDLQGKIAKATGFDKKIVLPTQFQIDLQFNGKEFAENAERVREQVKEVSKALFDGIVSGIEQGATLLGDAIGGILSGDGVTNSLASAAQGLLGIVGGILQQVGKEIIVTSKLVAALKKAIKGLFGPGGEGVALAVGFALIATGALLKNIKFDVPKLAQGGIATGPTLGIFGEAGKEAIIPLDKLPEIVGKLSMNSKADVMLAPTFRVSLTDIELGLERVRAQRRRLG